MPAAKTTTAPTRRRFKAVTYVYLPKSMQKLIRGLVEENTRLTACLPKNATKHAVVIS